MQVKAVIFDFGGTIDTNGIHWSEFYWDAYQECDLQVSKGNYEKAYVEADKLFNGLKDKSTLDFYGIQKNKIFFQLEHLYYNKLFEKQPDLNKLVKYNRCIADIVYEKVAENIKKQKPLIEKIDAKYKTALVSNFYGNIDKVLKEFEIYDFFEHIVDSAVVGIRKPDPGIFKIGCELLRVKPENTAVVGDSYSKDIEASKSLGCKTIWIEGRSWTKPESTEKADITIQDFNELNNILLD